MTILYEDARFLAADKPAGELVIPGRDGKDVSLVERLSEQAGRKLYVVHRLDRDASGLVLFAKTADAHRLLSGLFETRAMRKTYLACVDGLVAEAGEIDKPLRVFGSGRAGVDPAGKPSLTRYAPEKRFARATLLRVEPLTGRQHQIRAHLFSIGHPILGERRYGKDFPVGGAPRLLLHALSLAFTPPGETPLALSAPPPADFESVLNGLPC